MEKKKIMALSPKLRMALFSRFRTPTITYQNRQYVKEFDGWRGFGIIFVVLAHYFPSALLGSWIFMEMFFVMSGFLITGILIDSKGKANYYKRFMYRRVLRVFPLYYLCLIVMFFLLPSSWLDMSYYNSHQAWFWLYGENWLFSIDGFPAVKALRHFWSLAIEEQFYVSWPLLVALLSQKQLVRFCIFLFFFSILFRNIGLELGFVMPFPYVATFGRMEGIVLGAIIAILVRTDKSFILEKLVFPVTIVTAILALICFLVAGTMNMEYELHYRVTYTLIDLFFAGMIVLTICKDELLLFKKRILNATFFKTMGVMSYCFYIFHRPIQVIVQENLFKYFYQSTGSDSIGKIICIVISVLITVPFVYIIHKKIEVPLWNLKRRV